MIFLLMGIGGTEVLFIALMILLLFGGKKIPELMKGLGKGIHSFKEGVNGIEKDKAINPEKTEAESGDNRLPKIPE